MTPTTEQKAIDGLAQIQRDLSLAMNIATGLTELLELLLDATLRMESVDAGGVYIRDLETGALDLVVHRGLPEPFIASVSHYDGHSPQANLVAKGVSICGHYRALGIPIDGVREKEDLRAIAIIPVSYKKVVHAAVNIASHSIDELPEPIRGTAEAIANIAGGAIVRARMEAALRESEQRYRQLVELSPDPVVVLQDARFAFVNHAFFHIFGYNQQDVDSGLSFFDLVRPEDQANVKQRYEARLTNTTLSRTFTIDILAKDGSLIPCETSAALIEHKGRPADLVLVRDISERQQVDLERQCLEDKLRQSEKLEAIGQLAGGIAHDFNNQLAGIASLAGVIRLHSQDNARVVGYTRDILTTVKRAASLTEQLLAFARQGKYQNVVVDMHRTIAEVVSLLHHTIDKRIVIEKKLNARRADVLGDPAQLHIALLNLALNARDAMPDGGTLAFVTDNVACRETPLPQEAKDQKADCLIRISVNDSGIGMTPELQHRIFEPFFTTKKEGEGTGMGLAAVYGAVESHHGTIELRSTPGRGSTFEVYLPTIAPERSQYDQKPAVSETISADEHILLVDDEKIFCRATAIVLESRGYKVTTAHSGHKAIVTYNKASPPFDLVILDMIMPGMTGRETYLALREINPQVVVLLSSGFSLAGEAQEILNLGANGFLSKPFEIEELLEKLEDLLGRGERRI